MSKYILIIAVSVGIAIGTGGTLFISKAIKPVINVPECPSCNCPPAAEVSLQNFDLDKLNNKKGTFHLHNNISNVQIKIEAKDSVLMKQLLKR